MKSKIFTSFAYTQVCEELLAQRTSCESEAKRKQVEKEANRESRLREKEERQRQVRERAQMQEVNRRQHERREAEKRAADTRRRRRGSGSESVEAATPPQLQQMHTTSAEEGPGAFNGTLPLQFLWARSSSLNPIALILNSSFYYNQVLLPHLFPSGSQSLNMNDTNGCIPWMGNRLWEVDVRGTDHSTQRHYS